MRAVFFWGRRYAGERARWWRQSSCTRCRDRWPEPENSLENAALGPPVEALIDDLPVAKALGQIAPRDAGAKSEQNGFDEQPIVRRRAPTWPSRPGIISLHPIPTDRHAAHIVASVSPSVKAHHSRVSTFADLRIPRRAATPNVPPPIPFRSLPQTAVHAPRRRPPRGAGEGLLRPTPRPEGVLALDDMIAALVELDANGLCLQWRKQLGGTPPADLPRWLLMKILAYRIQVAAFGGLDKETLRVLRQPKGPTSCIIVLASFRSADCDNAGRYRAEGLALAALRRWKAAGSSGIILDQQGLRLERRDLRQPVASRQAITGTSWNGHRFFGLRTARSDQLRRCPLQGQGIASLASSGVVRHRPRRWRPLSADDLAGRPRPMRSERGKTTLRCAIYTRVST